MDSPVTPITPSRHRRAALILPTLAILISACSAGGSPSGASVATSPTGASGGGAALGAPALSQSGGTTAAMAPDTAIAYPYPIFGGTAGLAPDHELVVSGTGTATMKADGSDRATAERTALTTALADAKGQAEAAAAGAGVTLGGVVSLSVSMGGGYVGIMPMGASGAPETLPASGGTFIPPAAGGSAPGTPTVAQLEVTVTVAYSIS
jgi:Protein of unknown function (DUF541)